MTGRQVGVISAFLAAALMPLPLGVHPPWPFDRSSNDDGCSLALERLRASNCALVASDTAKLRDPVRLWGSEDCATPLRVHRVKTGGDPHPVPSGGDQLDQAYRRIAVRDGDDFSGERCELGRNSHLASDPTFTLYREGERRVTFISLRLPKQFHLGRERWQTVFQMKQAQPSANGGGGPMIEVQAYDHRFHLIDDHHELWTTRARRGIWTRFALDVRYSQDPGRGTLKMYVDGDGDGETGGRREESPLFKLATLRTETPGGDPGDGIEPGQPIPSHLRTGIYHDPAYACPDPRSCVIHVDNVQVIDALGARHP